MSVVPVGYANTNLVMFDPNDSTVYGTMGGVGFPDPLVPSVPSYYMLKTGNPAKAGQVQRYSFTLNVSVTFTTPQVTDNYIIMVIGGKPYGVYPGNGSPAPGNPTSSTQAFPLSQWTTGGATSAILTASGETAVLAENGIRMGIMFIKSLNPDTTGVSIDSLTYSYRLIG